MKPAVTMALAVVPVLLAACARVEPVSMEGDGFTLPTEAWVEACELRNSSLSLWFSANSAWCLRLGKAPEGIGRQWILPAGTRLRFQQKLRVAGIDADWALYRLQPPPSLPPTPGGLFVREDLLRFNPLMRKRPLAADRP